MPLVLKSFVLIISLIFSTIALAANINNLGQINYAKKILQGDNYSGKIQYLKKLVKLDVSEISSETKEYIIESYIEACNSFYNHGSSSYGGPGKLMGLIYNLEKNATRIKCDSKLESMMACRPSQELFVTYGDEAIIPFLKNIGKYVEDNKYELLNQALMKILKLQEDNHIHINSKEIKEINEQIINQYNIRSSMANPCDEDVSYLYYMAEYIYFINKADIEKTIGKCITHENNSGKKLLYMAKMVQLGMNNTKAILDEEYEKSKDENAKEYIGYLRICYKNKSNPDPPSLRLWQE